MPMQETMPTVHPNWCRLPHPEESDIDSHESEYMRIDAQYLVSTTKDPDSFLDKQETGVGLVKMEETEYHQATPILVQLWARYGQDEAGVRLTPEGAEKVAEMLVQTARTVRQFNAAATFRLPTDELQAKIPTMTREELLYLLSLLDARQAELLEEAKRA